MTFLFPQLAGFFAGLGLGMMFSAMESAVLSLNRMRLTRLFGEERAGDTNEQDIFRDTKEIYFVSRLGLCAAMVLAGFSFFRFAVDRFGGPPLGAGTAESAAVLPALLATLLVFPSLFLFFVFGLPRLLMGQAPISAEAELPGWMRRFIHAVRPLSRLARVSALLPLGRILPHHRLTKNDLVALVTDLDVDEDDAAAPSGRNHGAEGEDHSAAPGLAEETDEDVIIYNILDLDDTMVREVMKPINSVVAVRLETSTVEGVKDLASRTGYSRFPVYHERIVDLTGFVSIYDILNSDAPGRSLKPFVTAAYYVPEFMRVNDLLQEFLKRNVDAAVVVDEHGGSSGWITREDVLEEIVGEIEDEFDARRRRLRKCEDGSYLADGALDIDDLSEDLPVVFDDPQYDTLAGFILMELGRIPEEGDRVESDDATFTVERLEGNRIAQIRIRLHPVRRKNGV